MDTEGEGILVKLTRMEGKLDLSNMRHEQAEARLQTIDNRLHAHGNRIGVLEAKNHLSEGERKGYALSAKAVFALCGAVPVGLIAYLMRALGA